jgi:MFS transporter, ACS family, glucarate transporter
MRDLHLSESQWGWVLSLFILSYGLFQIPIGALGDQNGQRKILSLVVLWWSVFTILTGMAGGFISLLLVRFMFGIGEAGAYPCMTGTVAKWFPKSEIGKAQGYIWAASRIGGALTPFVVIPLLLTVGWRVVFYMMGGIGVIWVIIWVLWFRDEPGMLKGIKPTELDEIKEGKVIAEKVKVPWKQILKKRQFWLLLCMYWFYVWGSWFFFSWFPTFLEKGRGFEKTQLTYAIAIPFLMGVIGNISGGYLTDKLSKKYGLKIGRRLLGVSGLAISSIFMFLAGFIPGKLQVFIFLSLCFGVMDLMLPSAWAICVDIGKKHAGVISGAMNTAGNISGFVCAVVFGYIVESTGNYNFPLYIISGMMMISAFLFLQRDPTKELVPEE